MTNQQIAEQNARRAREIEENAWRDAETIETLHRQPKDLDIAGMAHTLPKCQWCNKTFDPIDRVWLCTARLGHYLVCDDCHEKAIIH